MLFPITSFPQQFHAGLEAFAISAGAFYYRRLLLCQGETTLSLLHGARYAVLLGCVFGAGIGNKLVFWIEMPHLLAMYWNKAEVWFAGQSMVGGLLGGLLGVELAKKFSGVRNSMGDAFVFPVLLGLMIGRIGCFVAGLEDGTYGVPTSLPWGIDFGDGIPRHPTQLYEIAFAALLWLALRRVQSAWAMQSGLLFKVMLCSYLLWRLCVDGLKPVPFDYGFGLSGIQVVCAIALLFYMPLCWEQWRKLKVVA
ncbi:Prolipoprotein diacylglyceryl transferase [Ferriphaselus amnicola]|uniref:Prolipoprotein diacylglyceryl transferase n=1 Tax=Ferriphaselus amnicola TaxID=1188319 RepID=A0A2Z6GB25_9PROT|nr:prolipoprotein diacylglyceryl transferase family protein [Ferriphaselus amnicola]BBE50435.1 Prolipoprotein diacylglyceryl transferase [Ferriphaselus amnicola]